MRKSLAKLAEKGGADPDEVLGRVEPVDDLVPADLMIEAVVEDAAVEGGRVPPRRRALFRRRRSSRRTRPRSRSPRSPRSRAGPTQVIGMHFFNPVPVMGLVEVIRGLETSDETAAAIVGLAEELGKTPAEARDFPGFVSNRILMPFINEAAYALHGGRRRAGGDRHDREARLQPPDGAARARRPDRPRHLRRDHGGAPRRASATRSTRPARCCASTSRRAGSAARAAAASTRTARAVRRSTGRRRRQLAETQSDRRSRRRAARRRRSRGRAPLRIDARARDDVERDEAASSRGRR